MAIGAFMYAYIYPNGLYILGQPLYCLAGNFPTMVSLLLVVVVVVLLLLFVAVVVVAAAAAAAAAVVFVVVADPIYRPWHCWPV